MVPYLSNFDQIKQEAYRLLSYSLPEIRSMDEEYVINLCCAFVASAHKKLTEYSNKYFGGELGEVYLLWNQYLWGQCCGRGGNIGLNPIMIFRAEENQICETLMHELTHYIHHQHHLPFWQHLQHLLFLEGLIAEEKPLRPEESEVKGRYVLYLGEEKVTDFWFYSESYGFKGLHFVQPDGKYSDMDIQIENKRLIEEILLQKLFKYQDLIVWRRANNSATFLVDDAGNFIPMRPLWDKYIERYHLKSVLRLRFYNPSVAKKVKHININDYKPFRP